MVSRAIVNEGPTLTTDQQRGFWEDFNGEDVRRAPFDIDDNKAPCLMDTLVVF